MKIESRSVLWAVGATIAIGLVISGVLVATRSPELLGLGTPEGTAQRYLQAVFDDEPEAAEAFLSTDLRGRCLDELDDAGTNNNSRAVLLDTTTSDDSAVVKVEITRYSDPSPFETSEYSFDIKLVLSRMADGWEISEAPWPVEYCLERSQP